jgi:hypothetical protein
MAKVPSSLPAGPPARLSHSSVIRWRYRRHADVKNA